MRGYGGLTRSYEQTAILFAKTYPNCQKIPASTVRKTVAGFDATGSVKDRPCSGKLKTVTTIDNTTMVMFIKDIHTFPRKAALKQNMSQSSVLRILYKEHWHPYKICLTR